MCVDIFVRDTCVCVHGCMRMCAHTNSSNEDVERLGIYLYIYIYIYIYIDLDALSHDLFKTISVSTH